MQITRRSWLAASCAAASVWAHGPESRGAEPNANPASRIPLIHASDLIHPPWDVDDQIDLACAYALSGLDMRAVIIDFHQKPDDKDPYEPAFHLITQLNWLTGRWVPAAVGPSTKLRTPTDDGLQLPLREQTGIRLLLDQLEKAETPVYISVTGSSRTVTAAFNRKPDLFQKKVRAILLVAGCVYRDKSDTLDTNCRFDANAFVGLMRSGLPIHWFPPGPVRPTSKPSKEQYAEAIRHHAKFITPYGKLLKDLPPLLHSWFVLGFSGNQRGDLIRPLYEKWTGCTWWGLIAKAESGCSSPPALLMAAGRRLVRTEKGWRFLAANLVPPRAEEFGWGLTPVNVTIDDQAHTVWEKAEQSNIQLYTHPPVDGIQADSVYSTAMTEALNALFREELLPEQ
ncbi:MAG: hypothetical protein JNM56_04685 [Planctomycetia bacterium]|nr:hypothetical protein [Planctomycetia bacterium]